MCPGCFEEEVPPDGERCPTCGWESAQDRPPLSLPIQTELKGRYVAGRVLGDPGGFGVTYLGYDRLQGEKVAIKEYFPREAAGRDTDGVSVVPHSGSGSEEFEYGKEQFMGEAQTLATFDHANIVSVRDFFEANGTAYLVMEYYEGKTLEAYLEEVPDGKMEPEAATEVMLRVLDGLKEVHSEGYLHRDVKPENVYLTKEGRPILIDFGAAREALGERSQSLSVVMTPGYAPYEQYSRKGNQGPHTDVYGAGATLYRMLTGQKPEAATDRVIEDTLEPPHEMSPEVSEGLSRAVMRALAMGDQERTSDAKALQRALRGEDLPPKGKKDVFSISKADGGGDSSDGEVKEDSDCAGNIEHKSKDTKNKKSKGINETTDKNNENKISEYEEKKIKRLMGENEEIICILGKRYLTEALKNRGKKTKGVLIVSNKRIYLKGSARNFSKDVGGFGRDLTFYNETSSEAISIYDIEEVEVRKHKENIITLFVLGLLTTPLTPLIVKEVVPAYISIVSIAIIIPISFLVTHITAKSFIEINHNGGTIAIKKEWYKSEEIGEFLSELRFLKNNSGIPVKVKHIE